MTNRKGFKMATLLELIESKKCRIGKHAGRDAGVKFWRPFEPIRIKRNIVNYNMISNVFRFEIRHFFDDNVEFLIHFDDWMDPKFSRVWQMPRLGECTCPQEIASILRRGVLWGEDEFGEPVYWCPLDNEGWDNLLEELEVL